MSPGGALAALNLVLRRVFNLVFDPLAGLSPWVGLVALSLVSAVAALAVYKRVSNQTAIEAVKRRMQAALFEIRLFNDDLRAILRAQGAFLLANLRYLGLNLVPLLWLLVPFVLVFVHLEPRYRYQGLSPREPAVVTARLAAGGGAGAPRPELTLAAPAGLAVTSPALWSAEAGAVSWRIRAEGPGAHELRLGRGGAEYAKEIRFGGRVLALSPLRPALSFLDQLAHPVEPPLPAASGLAAIEIRYPERAWGTVPGLGLELAWWFWWLVLMVAFGLVLRKPMGVQI